jgi:hypothetical protein
MKMKEFDERGREIVDVAPRPCDVNDEGIVYLPDGIFIEIVDAVLTSPLGKRVNVLMMFNSSMVSNEERINNCPSCNSHIPLHRPIYLMEDGDYVLPCLECEWVWFWVNSDIESMR